MNKIVNVNIMGLLYCTVEAVKLMKKSGSEGHIININRFVFRSKFLSIEIFLILINSLRIFLIFH